MSNAIEVDHVSKRFRLAHESNNSLKAAILRGGRQKDVREFWALNDVSFNVPEGTCYGLIGENGSGKSTMLKTIARILEPTKGTATVRGKMSALLELGAGFHPELTGEENVYLNGAILGMGKKQIKERFDDIVEFAGLEEFIEEPVKNYSSGMYVRLGFSVAINVDPDVLLVDEVLAVGDEAFQRKCGEKFADLKSQGKTIVLVSHGLAEVRNLCDKVAWFEHGRLVKTGPANDLIEEYVASVQIDREVSEDGARWGSGEGRIVSATLIDKEGKATQRVRSGDPVTLRLGYELKQPIERPVFAFGINTIEGTVVTSPNGRDGHCVPEKLDGTGHVDIEFDPLPLVPHTYDLNVSLWDHSVLHTYDFRQKALRFDVERGPIEELAGVVSLGGKWKLVPDK